ncbi:hypothetical protein [Williamsia sterculiae]|uniref:Uncharacterized protein n=1 Tax=Williamsia sterculiae TaxID=1344003 RepID=A0A1N7GFA6_9NOCA|nr:hypothetical protein [Williamsia sterculiae]SIS11228.1 hypothetical protein SAMN05445060_2714 [Williamsia sterculiae]
MSWQQVIAPNPIIACMPGWCLTYVQTAFRAPWAGSSATDAWNRARSKHGDANFPDGVAVPVYFAMAGVADGHIVIREPDGSIYSTSHPTANTPVHHSSLQALYSYYGGRLTLRGWSEDLNGFYVISQEPQKGDVMDRNDVVALYRAVLHREPESDAAINSLVGLKADAALNAVRNSGEWRGQDQALKAVPAGDDEVLAQLNALKGAIKAVASAVQ